MALDINKIIHDSINETKVDETENKDDKTEPIVETTTDQTIEQTTEENTDNGANQMSVASAISAGLGAMTLRNHLRNLNEPKS